MNLAKLIYKFTIFLRILVPLIIGMAVVIFLYGLMMYMTNIGDETKRKESIQYITSGLIGLFVMISIWGIVIIMTRTFGFSFGIPRIL